jgi:hypothetical protein
MVWSKFEPFRPYLHLTRTKSASKVLIVDKRSG